MAYEARRNDDEERMRNDQNNAKNIRNAADVAIASENPYGVAAGTAIKAADKLTDGRSTDALGRAMTRANETLPGGGAVQNASNRLSESGASDAIGKAAAAKNKQGAASSAGSQAAQNNENAGGGQTGSLPSSSEEQTPSQDTSTPPSSSPSNDANNNDSSGNDSDNKKEKSFIGFIGKSAAAAIAVLAFPFLLMIFAFLIITVAVNSIFGEFEDAFSISELSGEYTGEIEVGTTSEEQRAFYERVNDVKLRYQAQGITVDSLKIVAVFHVLNSNNANIDYEKISTSDIEEVVQAMLVDGVYDKYTFKNNLTNSIIPKYLPRSSEKEREGIADDIITYVSDYYELIGREEEDSEDESGGFCSTESGTCSYDIKGYSISGKGNIKENIKVSNLYVRLMQCGKAGNTNYGGTFGKPLDGEELVPFEKYILGVSYASLGTNAPAEAFKAQTVVARSYILARHADLGGWRTLKEENGKWIIQVASCAQDQIYCDPDQGCSSTTGGEVHSGTAYSGSFKKPALEQSSVLRSYAAATEGEVLVNAQGYIIYSGYSVSEKQRFTTLANQGIGYKQILLQVYNQGTRKYGASNVYKNSCTNPNNKTGCISSGEYSKWKQYSTTWGSVLMGNSGKTIKQIGCLATSISILIAKSGVPTNVPNFNPGTFVQYLSSRGGFDSSGNFVWSSTSKIAPSFKYQGKVSLSGMSRSQKLEKIRSLVNTPGVYVVAEVKGNTGQHWVAIDSVNGDTINMFDPGSESTSMWNQYHWQNTSVLSYFKVS